MHMNPMMVQPWCATLKSSSDQEALIKCELLITHGLGAPLSPLTSETRFLEITMLGFVAEEMLARGRSEGGGFHPMQHEGGRAYLPTQHACYKTHKLCH